jgi:hypothetical protein
MMNEQLKITAAYFSSCCNFCGCEVTVKRKEEAFLLTTDWNSIMQLNERPK